MATYGDKYYWVGTRTAINGQTIRTKLLIQQKNYTGIVRQMGDLRELHVGFNGSNDFSSAIIKSVLTFSLVDSRDKEQTPTVADSVKYGAWEEFYTSDATQYKVILMQGAQGAENSRWTGYITPDSWEEDLTYRGIVTITARDNIGYLSDFEFEDTGLISLSSIVSKVNELIGQSIEFDEDTETIEAWYTEADDETEAYCTLPNVTFDADCFEDKSWYEVLESVLESLGLCLRWQDDNQYLISAIYKVDTAGGLYAERTTGDVIFVNNSGHRTLDPAYKQIIDNNKFELKDDDADEPEGYVFKSFVSTYSFYGYYLNGNHWKTVMPSEFIRTLDPSGMPLYGGRKEWRAPESLMIRTSTSENNDYFYRTYLLAAAQRADIGFEVAKGVFSLLHSYDEEGDPVYSVGFNPYTVHVHLMIKWIPYSSSASVRYLASNGYWGITEQRLTFDVTGEAGGYSQSEQKTYEITTPSDPGYLEIRFYTATTNAASESLTDNCFAQIFNLTVAPQSAGVFTKDTVTTVNSATFNVTLKRSPELAQYPTHISAGVVKNAILSNSADDGYPSIHTWIISEDGTEYELSNLSVLVHQQLLCQHHTAMNILTGELMMATYDNPFFYLVWMYGNQKYYLTGGELNLLTGRIENAVLQQFLHYNELWTA